MIRTLLVDPVTGSPLSRLGDVLKCDDGTTSARFEQGIIRFPEVPDANMHLPTEIPDIHDCLRTRRILGRYIHSDVEWVMRRRSMTFMSLHGRRLEGLAPGSCVADLGCGQLPYWTALPHNRISAYYGFDGDLPSLARAAREFATDPRLHLVWSVAERTPVHNGVFDAVISSEVIEHVEDPMSYLREAWRILKPGGLLSLSTPCASMYCWPSELLKVVVGHTSLRTFWRRLTPERHWGDALAWHPALRPRVLAKWVHEAGFQVLRHDTTLWNTQTAIAPMRRLFYVAERLVGPSAGRLYDTYLERCDAITRSGMPLVRYMGLRQFILARKTLCN